MRIIIPANEAEEGCDFMQLDSTPKAWRRWCIGAPKPSHREILWSREIEPWVSVEDRFPENEHFKMCKTKDGRDEIAYREVTQGLWRGLTGHVVDVAHWLDTSLFPVPPKRDECEEAWEKWSKGVTFQSDEDEARQREAWTACWKAAKGKTI